MLIQTIRNYRRWLLPAALIMALTGVFLARSAFAKVAFNTINPVAVLSEQGRHLTVTGPLAVTAGERVELRVTVTQRTTGAMAEGDTHLVGTGGTNQWSLSAHTVGRQTFAPGPATATAVALTVADGGVVTDAHQWLVNITVVEQ
jgi:hypothetical protein